MVIDIAVNSLLQNINTDQCAMYLSCGEQIVIQIIVFFIIKIDRLFVRL